MSPVTWPPASEGKARVEDYGIVEPSVLSELEVAMGPCGRLWKNAEDYTEKNISKYVLVLEICESNY
jgi:hypothetical protein